MLRRLMVLVTLACCGRGPVGPSSAAGSTQATAIAVPLSVDTNETPPAALSSLLAPTAASRTPRWFVVTLPASEKRTLSVSVGYKGPARSVHLELLDSAGRVLAHENRHNHDHHNRSGWRSVWLDEAQGTYFVRVTTLEGSESYTLTVRSMAITPRPKDWPPCNPFAYDAANPRCAGIVACDPNRPVSTNPACCFVRCLRGECNGALSPADPEGLFAWLDLGAEQGITTWYLGDAELPLVGGTRAHGRVIVAEVERRRSKVVLSKKVDLARLAGTLARLQVPAHCLPDP